MWRGGQRDEENKLYAAVLQSMQDAAERGYQTIAIPAISAGVFKFPAERATEIILSASRDYLTDPSGTCLKEVHIVDNDPQVMSRFETELKSMTIPSGPGAEEGHPESVTRRTRVTKNDELTENASGEFTVYIVAYLFVK